MWSDNETNKDFLNFRTVADTAAEIIFRANGKPLSMGVSGGWGVGKSSMVKLISESLSARFGESFVFVEFNAWLYQGYDDAKAALMEVIAQELVKHAETHKQSLDQALEFLARIDWFRATGLVARTALAFKTAGLSEAVLWGAAKAAVHGEVQSETVEALEKVGKAVADSGKGILKPKKVETPPREIHHLREHFAKLLKDMEVTLVVFVDDLDRCLPDTAISTLEAMRLFLFMERTAFVIAADEKMIRHVVRAHFKDADLDDDLVTNYFDKLIQIPIRVPPLGTQEVRAYLFLLFIENSECDEKIKEAARKGICKQLGETWQGKRVDKEFAVSQIPECPGKLKSQFELANRIAPLMTSAQKIRGNPRLIKRFLNTLYIRIATASAQQVAVDEAALAKMLLFERCGNDVAYAELVKQINEDDDGKPTILKPWEEAVAKGEKPQLPVPWNGEFVLEWLALQPPLSDLNLKAVVYVSREHLPIITRIDQLSSEAIKLLDALLALKQAANQQFVGLLKAIGKRELGLILERLIVKAKQADEWGTPPILHACMATVTAEASLADVLTRFLDEVPRSKIKPSIVPLLRDRPWAQNLLSSWSKHPEISRQVQLAIKAEEKGPA